MSGAAPAPPPALGAGLVLALALGCATVPEGRRVLAADFKARARGRVAVLPFDNHSVDLVAPGLVRSLVWGGIRGHGYEPLPTEEVDAALRGIGITDGGQLGAVTPRKVGDALGAEGLFYGAVEEFAFFNVGFALRRVVRVRLRYVEPTSGEVLWEDSGAGVTERLTLRKKRALEAFMEGLLEKAIEGVFKTPLLPESREAVRRLMWSLPPWSPLPQGWVGKSGGGGGGGRRRTFAGEPY